MRRPALVLLVTAISLGALSPGGSGANAARVGIGRGLSVRLPPDWHLVRRVVGPSLAGRSRSLQAGVIASFPVAFGRHPCPCAHPNYRTCGAWCHETSIRNFPADGAIVFVWELPAPRNRAALGRGFVHRPDRFTVTEKDPGFADALTRELDATHRSAGRVCVEGPSSHPTWWSDFLQSGRVFQLEVYLGPEAGPAVRGRMDGMLDSLRVAAARAR